MGRTSPQAGHRDRYRERDRDRVREREKVRESDRSREKRHRERDERDRRRGRSPVPETSRGHKSRSRSPKDRRHRSRSNSPRNRRHRSRSKSPSHNGPTGGAVPNFLLKRPEITDKDLEGKSEEEQEMLKLMGFAGFDTTKGKKVPGNDVSAVHIVPKRKYRQYMNRKGGFNRPLDFVG